MTKVGKDEYDSFLSWLEDYEYNKLGIPSPDCVIYLDMPIEASQKLMTGRYNGNEEKKDIHEINTDYLSQCRITADYSCKKLGWKRISCAEDGNIKSIEDISDEIYDFVKTII